MKKKILSLLTAFAMVFGIIAAPFTSANAAEDKTNSVTLHKILMDKTTFGKFNEGKKGKDGTEYVGKEITNVKEFFAGTDAGQDAVAKEIPGAYFAWQKEVLTGYKKNKEGVLVDKDGQVIKANEKDYKNLSDEEKKSAVEVNEWKYIDENGDVTTEQDPKAEGFKDAVLGGLTGSQKGVEGYKFDTSKLPAGVYQIQEIHSLSNYVGEDNEALTDMKAVPVVITLPLVNKDGTVTDAHVYPKNTEEKPKIDKNFKGNNGLEAVEDENSNINSGAAYDNYQNKKATAEAEIGKNIPYEVKTEIPAKSNLAEAHWDDKMTEGLTFNGDLKVTIGETELTAEHYTLEQDEKGFSVRLNEKGLALVNGKDAAVTVVLTYSATVNEKAIVDIPEANDITFHYGNTPSKGNTPKPTKPNDNGEVTVEKTWGGQDKDWVEGEYAKFKLVDANTGEDVTKDDLVDAPEDYEFQGTVTLEKSGNKTYTWKYLNKDKSYKVVEIESKTLSDAEYTVNEQGKVEVTNHKSTNPKPLNPTEPKVVLGGKKFVKTNEDGTERLDGAEFYVKNSKNQYLVEKKATEDQKADVANKKSELDSKVKAYNDLSAEDQEGEKGTKAKQAIDAAQKAYNDAVIASVNKYQWGNKTDDGVVVLTSQNGGKFEITGLEYGDYKLEEKKAPEGYAKRSGDVPFTVEKGSYESGDIYYDNDNVKLVAKENQTLDDATVLEQANIEGMTLAEAIKRYDTADDQGAKDGKLTVKEFKDGYYNALQVINKKVTIPQTGGIGSLIFIVAGLAIMGGAFVAYKKSQATA